MSNEQAIFNQIKWNEQGLISCVAQCHSTQRVLMVAWMNEDALRETLRRQELVYWSRSRAKLWHKGESSGNTQKLIHLQLDCDGDCLLAQVEQSGNIACHTGTNSCFFREYQAGEWTIVEKPIKNPEDIYT